MERWSMTVARSISKELADFVADTHYDDLPGAVIHTTKRALLDLIGCGLAAVAGDDVQALLRGVREYDHQSQAVIWGTSERVSLPGAAMINGTSAHAREFDDCGGPGHVGTVVIPASLAIGDFRNCTGKELIAAVALGYEILFRLTDGAGGYTALAAPGWHPISVVGGFGSAAAGGKLEGLDSDQITSALGLAGSFSGGSHAYLDDGSMAKRWHPGRASANGLEAVFIAKGGFVGPSRILDATWGSWYDVHFPNATTDLPSITKELGAQYRMVDTTFKAYPCCRGIHQYLEAYVDLVQSLRLEPQAIDRVEADVGYLRAHLISKNSVETTLDAQMSLAYTLAVFSYTGRTSLAEFELERLKDPAVTELAKRVEIITTDDDAEKEIRVHMADGTMHNRIISEEKGSLARPLSDDELTAKFDELAAPVLGPDVAFSVARRVWDLDEVSSVRELTNLLAT
jgi:2-methylcitrate dehydratase PrpD